MPIEVTRPHQLDAPTLRRRAEQMAEHLGSRLKLQYEWSGDRLLFRRRGLDGYIDISGDEVTVWIDKRRFVPVSSSYLQKQVELELERALDVGSP